MDRWRERFEAEIAHAERARQSGNEGMARVCARRAAGIVAAEYLQRVGIQRHDPSAYESLRLLSTQSDLSDEVLQIIEHLLVRITPEHTLPVAADLPGEAVQLRRLLLDH